MKPKVLVDVDGVLADFTGRVLELVAEETGVVFHDEPTAYQVYENVSEGVAGLPDRGRPREVAPGGAKAS